ncbi:MAG: hypothetical protein JXK93_03250 [Sphaerochaetaceae bacterium]|nr:hypothetical protein [Sphaerochaetaceae bacterium]
MTTKNRKRTILSVLLTLAVTVITLPASDISFTGLSQTRLALAFEDAAIPYYEQKLDMHIDIYKHMSHLFIQPYLSVDQDEDIEFAMRELYADFYLDAMDIRVGKQIIATGQADGLYLTNMISPLNMSDFLLSETHELQMGVPAVKASYYYDAFTFTALWISHFVPAETFSSDSYWFNSPTFLSGGSVNMADPETPELSIENSEVFGKASYFGALATVEVLGGYTWTDTPYAFSIDTGTGTITTEYGRYGVLGAAVSAPVSSAVLRTEILASFDKPFASVVPGTPPSVSVEEHSVIDGILGIDIDLAGFSLSAQYRGTYMTDHNETLITDGKPAKEYAQLATLNIQKSFLDDTLTAGIFTIVEFDEFNILVRPSVTYIIEDAVEIEAELILFAGDDEGTYGVYNDRSVTSLSLNYYF